MDVKSRDKRIILANMYKVSTCEEGLRTHEALGNTHWQVRGHAQGKALHKYLHIQRGRQAH